MARKFTSLFDYSQWDGSQQQSLNADDIIASLSDDLMEYGDLQQAMRYLMQRGMDSEDGGTIRGLRDLLKQLKQQRNQRLERYDMGSVLDDIKRQLDEILDMESQTIEEWINQEQAGQQSQKFMDDLLDGLNEAGPGQAGSPDDPQIDQPNSDQQSGLAEPSAGAAAAGAAAADAAAAVAATAGKDSKAKTRHLLIQFVLPCLDSLSSIM